MRRARLILKKGFLMRRAPKCVNVAVRNERLIIEENLVKLNVINSLRMLNKKRKRIRPKKNRMNRRDR